MQYVIIDDTGSTLASKVIFNSEKDAWDYLERKSPEHLDATKCIIVDLYSALYTASERLETIYNNFDVLPSGS